MAAFILLLQKLVIKIQDDDSVFDYQILLRNKMLNKK